MVLKRDRRLVALRGTHEYNGNYKHVDYLQRSEETVVVEHS